MRWNRTAGKTRVAHQRQTGASPRRLTRLALPLELGDETDENSSPDSRSDFPRTER